MSWDIFVQDLPVNAEHVSDIPDDFEPKPIGRRVDIIAKIQDVIPLADFSDQSCINIDGSDFSVEVCLGNEEEVSRIAFHVRGGDAAVPILVKILHHLELRAVDASTGDFFNPEYAVESLRRWRKYRDKVVGNTD